MIASIYDKDSYNTVTSMLHTYEKEKYETYDINDQLRIHSIKELLFIRENNDFLSVLLPQDFFIHKIILVYRYFTHTVLFLFCFFFF